MVSIHISKLEPLLIHISEQMNRLGGVDEYGSGTKKLVDHIELTCVQLQKFFREKKILPSRDFHQFFSSSEPDVFVTSPSSIALTYISGKKMRKAGF